MCLVSTLQRKICFSGSYFSIPLSSSTTSLLPFLLSSPPSIFSLLSTFPFLSHLHLPFPLSSPYYFFTLLIGTASSVLWKICVNGRLFHSGLPHKGINSLELASEAMAYIQRRFYEDFPPVSVYEHVYLSLSHPPPYSK